MPAIATPEEIRAVAHGLSQRGMKVRAEEIQGCSYLTVTAGADGRAAEVIVDQDGYLELRWWADPDATPAQVCAAVARVVAAIVPPAGDLAHTPASGAAPGLE